MDLREVARDPMQRLGDLTGETIHLSVYDEPHVVYIYKNRVDFPDPDVLARRSSRGELLHRRR
jgi:DNA-binding IclR family transcriptional regulator